MATVPSSPPTSETTRDRASLGGARNPGFPLELEWVRALQVNRSAVERRASTLAMNPKDAEGLSLIDGQTVRITTEAASAEVELEVTEETSPGLVIIPHGFGLDYEGKRDGVNVNLLTKNTNRDPLAATPLHRYVPCRVEPV